jgi:cytochrome P450
VVGVNPWAIHRNTDIFGADADHFRPERWLGPKEKVSVMEQNSFAVSLHSTLAWPSIVSTPDANKFLKFGSGVRTCIGRHISFLEINKVIPELLRQFQFCGADEREWTTSDYWFVKPSYECRVTARRPAAATT